MMPWELARKQAVPMRAGSEAQVPDTAPFMAWMDDLFGYGLVPEAKYNEWWNLRLPTKGFDSHRTRS